MLNLHKKQTWSSVLFHSHVSVIHHNQPGFLFKTQNIGPSSDIRHTKITMMFISVLQCRLPHKTTWLF